MIPNAHPEAVVPATLGSILPVWSAIPFAALLLSLAFVPLFAPRFWKKYYPLVVSAWALALAVPFLAVYGKPAAHELVHMLLLDYIPFIILLLALFTVAGGIHVEGALKGTPLTNTLLLFIGTVAASWIGTTGASMLLIRPVIRTNAVRRHKAHVVIFFIFLVSNIGGSLTPLGDPPLFLGFLRGVPFFWTLHLLPVTLFAGGALLALFFAIDFLFYRHERRRMPQISWQNTATVIRLRGKRNILWLAVIIGAVLFSGTARLGEIVFLDTPLPVQNLLRDLVLLAAVFASVRFTPRELREANHFSWEPIREVAIIFVCIFVTIVPVLAMLRSGNGGHLAFITSAAVEPWHYFWITGLLSSFLDNAPTYLTFLTTALGNCCGALPEREAVAALIAQHPLILEAISAGAVFMGAYTYIGNAPNFMVRVIAEENKIRMPSFFGYMLWAFVILFPVFAVTTFIFFV